jgi:hypothetical protein
MQEQGVTDLLKELLHEFKSLRTDFTTLSGRVDAIESALSVEHVEHAVLTDDLEGVNSSLFLVIHMFLLTKCHQ